MESASEDEKQLLSKESKVCFFSSVIYLFTYQAATVTCQKDPDPIKTLKQCEFDVDVLGPRKCHCIKNLDVK